MTIPLVLLSGLASAQLVVWPLIGSTYEVSKATNVITVRSIEPLSSLDNLFRYSEKRHVPSFKEPRKYFFYIHTSVSRSHHYLDPQRSSIRLLIDYEISDGSEKINGPDIEKYIDGEKELVIQMANLFRLHERKWVANSYQGIGVKFKDAYYKAGLNKHKLVIRVSEEGNPSKMGTLTIEPMTVRVKLNRMPKGCSNRISLAATRASTTTKSSLDLFYSGTAEDDLDDAPQSVDMDDLVSSQINIPLKKIYANRSKKLGIVAHARGYTPSWHELSIPVADGLSLGAGEPERDQETKMEHIPMTINIPECHVNKLYPMLIKLSYSGSGQMDLDSPPLFVTIPVGQSQCQFDIPLKSSARCARNLRVTASSSEFEQMASLKILLPESNQLQLRATHHAKQKNLHEHISVSVKMIKCSSSSPGNATVRLSYEGDGAPYLINPPSTIDLSDGSKTISIYVDRQDNLCNESLDIAASSNDTAIASQTITLENKTLVLSAGK